MILRRDAYWMSLCSNVRVLTLLLFFLFPVAGGALHCTTSVEAGNAIGHHLAQDYATITIDSREISLVPEDPAPLLAAHPEILADSDAADIVQSNRTFFWEDVGPYGPDLSPNSSLSSVVLVQVDSGNISEYVVSLSASDGLVFSTQRLDSSSMGNLSAVVRSATDFFINDGLYWGLCEEMILLPGPFLQQGVERVWRLAFYLIGEGERWTLVLDTSGTILNEYASTVSCQSCSDLSVITAAALGVSVVTAVVLLRLRAGDRHPNRPESASDGDQNPHQESRT